MFEKQKGPASARPPGEARQPHLLTMAKEILRF